MSPLSITSESSTAFRLHSPVSHSARLSPITYPNEPSLRVTPSHASLPALQNLIVRPGCLYLSLPVLHLCIDRRNMDVMNDEIGS